jgi:hypothetical protein
MSSLVPSILLVCSNTQGASCGSYAVTIDGEPLQSGAKFGERVATPAFGKCVPKTATCAVGELSYQLDLKFDNYPQDTSWSITTSGGGLVALGGSYTTEKPTIQAAGCLPANACYALSISDIYGDGICCATGYGAFQLAVNGILLWTGGEFADSTTSPQFGDCSP